tara:strand:- start:57 stop:1145 length:1089 start_codon:yes stop_codon:yes gene_type:complete
MCIFLIGKNLTNLVLANVIANKKLRVDIAYNLNTKKNESSRTLSISHDNYIYLKKINKKINISAWPTKKIKIYNEIEKFKELFEFKNNKKDIFYLIKYHDIYNFFLNFSKKNKFINFVKINSELKNINHKKTKYNLIINSTSNNFFTKKNFYKKIEKDYNSEAYTLIITHKKTKNNVAIQIFTKIGPLAFLPLSNDQTSVVFSYNGKKKITDEEVEKIIKEYNLEYQIIKFGKIEKFDLKFYMLREYGQKNILPFGDFLHRVHPLAGQGFNMTIRDIKILSKLIDEKISLGMEIDSSIIDDFQNETRHLNFIYASSIDFVYQFFNLDNKINNILSEPFFEIIKNKKILNKFATHFADKGLVI